MDEKFKQIYKDYKRGNVNNIYYIIDVSLYIVLTELLNLKEISKQTIVNAINSLINSIETYSYEKACDFFVYSKMYVNFYLTEQTEVKPLINISKEKMDEYVKRIQKSYNLLKQSGEKNEKNEKNTIKMLLLFKKNGIL